MAQQERLEGNHSDAMVFWRYICSSIDRLIAVADGLGVDELNWRPPAPETNSIYVLVNHTLANVRVNLLGALCGETVPRDREGEFTVVADASRDVLVSWPPLRDRLHDALSFVNDEALARNYQHHWRGQITGRELLLIVARHAAEHLGQAELTRDLVIAAREQ